MRSISLGLLGAALGFAVAVAGGARAEAADCSALAKLALTDTSIVSATPEPAGDFKAPAEFGPGPEQTVRLPAHCRVQGVLKPTPDSEIAFEVWLPAEGWNGRFQGVGNGGFAGAIGYSGLIDGVQRGYAVASTDTGHRAGGTDAQWAFGHPEKLADFGWRAIHLTAVVGKQLTAAFYGQAPRHAYFASCSNGGRQGLMEAQRFPDDYDGIIAGAPAYDWSGLFLDFLWNVKALSAPGAAIPAAKTPAIAAAVLASCDKLDGIQDGLVSDPRRCRFDPETLRCRSDDSSTCLTGPQIAALRAIYKGPHTSSGRQLYVGFPPGGETAPGFPNWDAWIFGGPNGSVENAFMSNFMKYAVGKGQAWSVASFDFDRDVAGMKTAMSPVLDATDPDLTRFARRGGKLILYHGWSDGGIPAEGTIAYYDRVSQVMGPAKARGFTRLFMVPGMHHCGGGTGPSDFGGRSAPVLPRNPATDLSAAIEAWVEEGRAPEQVVARQVSGPPGAPPSPGPVRTGLICAYPNVAVLKPGGAVNDAASYQCALPRRVATR